MLGIRIAEEPIVSNETKQQAWVRTWARRIETVGLSPVVLPLLDVVQALGFLGSQALLLIQPLVKGIATDNTLERTMALLDNPELLEQLRARLEEGEC